MTTKPRRSLNEALFATIDGKLKDRSYLKLRHTPRTNGFLSLDVAVAYEEP